MSDITKTFKNPTPEGVGDGLQKTFKSVSDALSKGNSKVSQTKIGINSTPIPKNPNIARMKEMGLTSMPEGGQAELDQMYAAFKAKSQSKPKTKMQTMYPSVSE